MHLTTDTFHTYRKFRTDFGDFYFYSLKSLEEQGFKNVPKLPFTIKILLESLLRNEDNITITNQEIINTAMWSKSSVGVEIPFIPTRIIMQDSSGIPSLVDLATLREKLAKQSIEPEKINPSIPVDLVIDHSLQVDYSGTSNSLVWNLEKEYERNEERYKFLKWAQQSFENLRIIPPGNGIIHQVNLEYLAQVVQKKKVNGDIVLMPDTLIGTDSHTTMINGLGVLGWGVGGIEAEAVMLGQPKNIILPQVVGVKLTGLVSEGVSATDVALTITQLLRRKDVVGKFVEFYGPGMQELTLADRATIANMAPEYGATMGYFPVDQEALNYLRLSGRQEHLVSLVERYTKEQGLFYTSEQPELNYSESIEFDLSSVEASISGPKRPQDRMSLSKVKESFDKLLGKPFSQDGYGLNEEQIRVESKVFVNNEINTLNHGSIVIASITSCTNTSNPANMMAAGLLAKKAIEKGLKIPSFIKTSMSPGSKVVTRYLEKAGLTTYLDELGFYNVGYGCATCVGNSGPINTEIQEKIKEDNLVVASILSGNRNFEGRIHPDIKANYLVSPPLVIAYALAGTVRIDLNQEPIGVCENGQKVYLKDIWPSMKEIKSCIDNYLSTDLFNNEYNEIFKGDENWAKLEPGKGQLYNWDEKSTYFKISPFFDENEKASNNRKIDNARVLLALGDSVTTDHISPVGSIARNSEAGKYLLQKGVKQVDFNTYGARRGNHEVLVKGTFSNPRLKNQLVEIEGGFTKHFPTNECVSVFEASQRYKKEKIQLLILAGKEYGTGSARDWAAKGTKVLGVEAVLAESFERIHRSNLAMMGVLPLQFLENEGYHKLNLTGEESFSIQEISEESKPFDKLKVIATRLNGNKVLLNVLLRLETQVEIDYYINGGMLQKIKKEYVGLHNTENKKMK